MLVSHVLDASLERRILPLDLPLSARQSDLQRINLAAATVPPGLSADTRVALHSAIALAFVDGFRYVMWMAAGLAISSAAIAALLLGDSARQR